MGVTLADTAESVLRNVEQPTSAAAVKKYLESTSIKSIAPIKFTPESHVGMGSSTVSVLEYKNGHWAKADPIK
jgi:hypothetical protein